MTPGVGVTSELQAPLPSKTNPVKIQTSFVGWVMALTPGRVAELCESQQPKANQWSGRLQGISGSRA